MCQNKFFLNKKDTNCSKGGEMAQKRTEYWREWERKNRARRNEYHRNLYRKTKNKTIKGESSGENN